MTENKKNNQKGRGKAPQKQKNKFYSQKSNNPREVALLVLHKVENEGAFSNLALNGELQKRNLTPLDKGLATELVYGTLRNQGEIDYILSLFLTKPLSKLPLWILLILRLGLYQMRHMDKIPDSAAINESVKLAKKYGHQGTAGLVNGTLRNILRNPEKIVFPDRSENPALHLSVCYSHPLWLIERWLREYGFDAAEKLCAYNNSGSKLSLRTNTLKIQRQKLLDFFASQGIAAEASRFTEEGILTENAKNPAVLAVINKGLAYPQHESSMLAALALAPKPGSNVLDTCSAPGGKTTHLAQLMNNQGCIKAFDIHEHKIALIEANCKRLGIDIVEAAAADSRNLTAVADGWADYALVDAPCSGLGVLRIRPDARWQKSAESINELADIAYGILRCAAKKVKVGGKILFSTCTITHEENIDNINRFLREHDNYRLVPIGGMPKQIFENEACWQILPQKHNLDGFFLAKLERVR